jgi:hypothetical protein
MMNHVYADFNNCDAQGRIRLNTAGSIDDMETQNIRLSDGMILAIYSEDLEATGVARELAEGGWGVELDWEAVRDRE